MVRDTAPRPHSQSWRTKKLYFSCVERWDENIFEKNELKYESKHKMWYNIFLFCFAIKFSYFLFQKKKRKLNFNRTKKQNSVQHFIILYYE